MNKHDLDVITDALGNINEYSAQLNRRKVNMDTVESICRVICWKFSEAYPRFKADMFLYRCGFNKIGQRK